MQPAPDLGRLFRTWRPGRLVPRAGGVGGGVPVSVDAGVMRMRGVAALEVKPGETLQLRPGGYHVMLSELRQPLKVGDKFPMTLKFQNAGAVEVSVWVEEMGAAGSTAHGR